MEKLIYVEPENSAPEAPAWDHCYFSTDQHGRARREINLKDTYPYCAFPVSYDEFIHCTASHRDERPVKITDGRYIREARVIRATSLGVVCFRFTETARPVGK
jgi:hypothetical protein